MSYNVGIIGSGPAALTAAIYLSRAGLHPILFEGLDNPGGLIVTTKSIENYPGFPEGISGYELSDRLKNQALQFGTKILPQEVVSIAVKHDNTFDIITNCETYHTRSIIVATGSNPRHLDHIDSYWKYWGKGISTCAVCDGALPCYRNVPIAVVGGGDSACEFALTLTRTASKVHLIHRGDSLSKASHIMQRRVEANDKIEIHYQSYLTDIIGDGNHISSVITNHKELQVRGLFVAIGHIPNTKLLAGTGVQLDPIGHVIVNSKKETNIPGIYAAGDVEDVLYKQAVTASSSGCIAALEVERYLEDR